MWWMIPETNAALVPFGLMGIKEETFCNSFAELNLMQHNDFKNKSDNLLDLCFTSFDRFELKFCDSVVPLDYNHLSFIIIYVK